MKNLISFIVFCLLSSVVHATSSSTDTYAFPKDLQLRVVLEMGIANSEILNPEALEHIGSSTIISIDYVYTSYAPGGYDQTSLNEDRARAIKKLLGQRISADLPWNEIVQTVCKTHECAASQLHGFVITYEPSSLLHHGRLEPQHFTIDADRGGTYRGHEGSKISVPSQAFIDAYGNIVHGQVDLYLKEAISPKQILLAGLKTVTTDGHALQSGGMIELKAFQNGKNLELGSNKTIDAEIRTDSINNAMRYYEGVTASGQVSWNNPTPLAFDYDTVRTVIQKRVFTTSLSQFEDEFDYGASVYWSGDVSKNKAGNIIRMVEWEQRSSLERIKISINGNVIEYLPNEYTVNKAQTDGLDLEQAERIMEWFESDTTVGIIEVSANFNAESIATKSGYYVPNTSVQINARSERINVLDANGRPVVQSTGYQYYPFGMSTLGWANIDCLFKGGGIATRTSLKITPKGLAKNEIADVKILIPSLNSCIRASKGSGYYYSISNGKQFQAPRGLEALAVITYISDEEMLFGIQAFEFGNQSFINPTLQIVTEDEALSMIDEFF